MAQSFIGINFNRNFCYDEQITKSVSSNNGYGASFYLKDSFYRFLNYELSLGFDFNNLTFIEKYYNPPYFVDYNENYTHKINTINADFTVSVKTKANKKYRYFPYFGMGVNPKFFILSRAKVLENNLLLARTNGIRLKGVYDLFKMYDLFYCGIELKKIDVRILSKGLIFKKAGLSDLYYFNTEGVINLSQFSLQIILNI